MHSIPQPASFEPFDRGEIDQSIPERFGRIVSRAPDRTALRSSTRVMTYRELNAAADQVAHAIRAAVGASPEPVALLIGQGAGLTVAILGVLKAGHFYVPLEASYPEAALAALCVEAGVRLIVTDASNRPLAARLPGATAPIDIDQLPTPTRPEAIDRAPSPDDLAYIYYTSGTTGRPKGVTDMHRNVLHNVMRYTNALYFSKDDRLTLLQAPMFSGAVSSLFGALLNGATICPYDVPRDGVAGIGRWLLEERITLYHSVPSIFRHFLRAIDERQTFPSVRIVRLEGDGASPGDVELFRRHFSGDAALSHGLGATECGLVCRFLIGRDSRLDGPIVPIGYPVEDMTVRIVDERGRDVPPGEPGEIGVESRYLSPGYWKRPDLTPRAFGEGRSPGTRLYRTGDLGRVRADGCIEHLGRRDLQPKVRGQQVDSQAIEAALVQSDLVSEAVVDVRGGSGGDARLVAYVVPRGSTRPSTTVLRRDLARTLPPHLIPSRFVLLDALPLTSHGKIHRAGLPDPDHHRPELDAPYIAPESELEIGLARLYCETLGLEPVGVHDDFFDLGGDSLAAMLVLERVHEEHGVELAPQVLFESSTVAGLAAAVERARSSCAGGAPGPTSLRPSRPVLVPVQPAGTRRPFFFLHAEYGGDGFYCLGVARHLGMDRPFYALSPHGRDGGPMPVSVETMATEYVRALRRVQARGPYRLGGFCSSAVVAWELARQLTASGDGVDLLALIEPPDITRSVRWRVMYSMLGALGALRGHGPEQRSAQMSAAIRRVRHGGRLEWRDLGRAIRRLTLPRTEIAAPHTLEERRAHIARTYDRAVRAYLPGRFDGSVLCLRARDVTHHIPVEPWRRLAREFTERLIPGDHNSCILGHADSLAEALRAGLVASEGRD